MPDKKYPTFRIDVRYPAPRADDRYHNRRANKNNARPYCGGDGRVRFLDSAFSDDRRKPREKRGA